MRESGRVRAVTFLQAFGDPVIAFALRCLMSLRKTAPCFLALSLCALALACSGNDAKRCKVSTMDDGGVRVACPGSPAIVLPPGTDSSGLPDECVTEQNPQTGDYTLRCKETVVALGRCGLGVDSDLFLGDESDEFAISLPPELRRNNWRTIAEAQEKGCDRVLGTVWISEEGAERYHDFLQTLTYAQVIEFIGPVEGLSLPELRAAQIRVGDRPKVWATLRAPNLRAGGVEIIGGSYEGPLDFDTFVNAALTVTGVEGVTELNARELRAGHIEFANLPDLVRIELPSLRFTEELVFEHLPSLREVNAPSLEYVGRVRLADLVALEMVDLSGLVHVRGNLEFHRFGAVESLLFPKLESAHIFTIESNPSLQLVRAEKLKRVGERIAIGTDATSDETVLDIILPALESARSASFSNVNLRKLDLSSFTGVTDRPVGLHAANLVLTSSVLEELILPNLRNTGLYVTLNGSGITPVLIDVSNFYFDAVDSTNVLDGHAMKIAGTQSNSVILKMGNVYSSWQVVVEGVRFAETFTPGPSISGAFQMTNVPSGSMVDLTNNVAFRRIILEAVGSEADPYFLRLLSPSLTELEVQGGHMNGAEIASADGAMLRIGSTDDSHFEGDISLLGTTHVQTNRSLRLFGAPIYSAGELLVGTISSGDITRLQMELYVSSVESLELGSVEHLSIFGTTSEISYLDISSIQSLSASPPLDLSSVPIEGLVLNPVPQPGITGTIKAEWSGLACPVDLFALLPNVTFNTGCSSP